MVLPAARQLLAAPVETRQKNRVSVEDVVSPPASRELLVTTPPWRLPSLAVAAAERDRTMQIVPDCQAGAAALRRTTACRGGGITATTRGGR